MQFVDLTQPDYATIYKHMVALARRHGDDAQLARLLAMQTDPGIDLDTLQIEGTIDCALTQD